MERLIISTEYCTYSGDKDRVLSLELEQGILRLCLNDGDNVISLYLTSEWSYINWLVANIPALLNLAGQIKTQDVNEYWFDGHVQHSSDQLVEEFNSTLVRLGDIITKVF